MKKTIIASAIAAAVAAPAAFADVSISGQMNNEYSSVDGADWDTNLHTDIVFSGSEDLGNGMKASFKIVYTSDDHTSDETDASQAVAASAGVVAPADAGHGAGSLNVGSTAIIGLSGDFGSITMGRQEGWSESAVAAMAANDPAEELANEVAHTDQNADNDRIQYTSPSFNGIKFVVDTVVNGTDADNDGFGVEYSNGPLLVRAASTEDDTLIAAQYKMGDFTVKVVDVDGDADETWVGAEYAMGANTIAISNNSDTEVSTFSVKHAMSKNVSVYAVMLDDDTDANDETLIGMQVKF
jgi:predicted porin